MIRMKRKNLGEIRMGSPFDHYDITLTGDWIPDLPSDASYLKPYVRSPDERYLVLTVWDTTGNRPGFLFYLIDTEKRSYLRSGVFEGACTKLTWTDEGIRWEAWHVDGKRSGVMEAPGSDQ